MTSLGGFAANYAMLAATRIGVAVSEAGGNPASQSVISDLFPLNKRATAIGLLNAGQEPIRYALIGPVAATLLAGVAALLGARHVRADYATLKSVR